MVLAADDAWTAPGALSNAVDTEGWRRPPSVRLLYLSVLKLVVTRQR